MLHNKKQLDERNFLVLKYLFKVSSMIANECAEFVQTWQ